MTCYVDQPRWVRNGLPSGHLIGDTLDELHALAEAIGLGKQWFQGHAVVPHYTLLGELRPAALAAGAVALEQGDWKRTVARLHTGADRRYVPAGPDPMPRRRRPAMPTQGALL